MADPSQIAQAVIVFDGTVPIAELARLHLTTLAGLDRLNAPNGISIGDLSPGDTLVVPIDLPADVPFATVFWNFYGASINSTLKNEELLYPFDWVTNGAARLSVVSQTGGTEAEFVDGAGNDTRISRPTPISVQPGVPNLPPAQDFININDPETEGARASGALGGADLASTSTGTAATEGGQASLGGIPGDTNGDGVLSAADSPDIFGPNGSIGAPPGWAWAFDPTIGDFTIRKLDPVGDPSRLDEWIWQPGPDFDPENPSAEAGQWTRIASPNISDPLANVPAPVRPFLQAVLNGEMTTAEITDASAQQWVRFILRGITDDSLRRGLQPATLPFGTVTPSAAPVAPTATFDSFGAVQQQLLASFGLGPTSSPEDIATALEFIGGIPAEDLAARVQGGSLGGTPTDTQIIQGQTTAPAPTVPSVDEAPPVGTIPPPPMRVTDGLVDDNALLSPPPPPAPTPPPELLPGQGPRPVAPPPVQFNPQPGIPLPPR